MISFALWLAISSQQICDESTRRNQCTAWAEQCLVERTLFIDTEEARDWAFEFCAENVDNKYF